jgi:Ser/Thr protein kinase RdoA (MazF antagonist)
MDLINTSNLDNILDSLTLPRAKAVLPLEGGSGKVFRVDLHDGTSVVLKNFEGKKAPELDELAAGLLSSIDVPISKYLLVDSSCRHLPFAFALTNYILGSPATQFATHRDYRNVFVQIGVLSRKLHSVTLSGFGALAQPEHAGNASYVKALANHAFERFLHYGADSDLEQRLRSIFKRDFDALVPASGPAVFAHDDLHPGNILVLETEGLLTISGLIDFGNARAHSAVMDLAKTIFICEHMAPGSGSAVLAGYGPINHPAPRKALAYYTMLHRVTMWWWLRHIGALATPDAESDLMRALEKTALSPANGFGPLNNAVG